MTSQRRQTALASSICSSAGPVFPMGKNSSGSSSRQAARSRQSMGWFTPLPSKGVVLRTVITDDPWKSAGRAAHPRVGPGLPCWDAAVRPSFIQRQASHPCARLHKGFCLQIHEMETLAVTLCYGARWRYLALPTRHGESRFCGEIHRTLDVALECRSAQRPACPRCAHGGPLSCVNPATSIPAISARAHASRIEAQAVASRPDDAGRTSRKHALGRSPGPDEEPREFRSAPPAARAVAGGVALEGAVARGLCGPVVVESVRGEAEDRIGALVLAVVAARAGRRAGRGGDRRPEVATLGPLAGPRLAGPAGPRRVVRHRGAASLAVGLVVLAVAVGLGLFRDDVIPKRLCDPDRPGVLGRGRDASPAPLGARPRP